MAVGYSLGASPARHRKSTEAHHGWWIGFRITGGLVAAGGILAAYSVSMTLHDRQVEELDHALRAKHDMQNAILVLSGVSILDDPSAPGGYTTSAVHGIKDRGEPNMPLVKTWLTAAANEVNGTYRNQQSSNNLHALADQSVIEESDIVSTYAKVHTDINNANVLQATDVWKEARYIGIFAVGVLMASASGRREER